MNSIWLLWYFVTIEAHMWWWILVMHVPRCITIMMSPFVIACYYEKCRILKIMDFVPELTLVVLHRYYGSKNWLPGKYTVYLECFLVHAHHVCLMYLHQQMTHNFYHLLVLIYQKNGIERVNNQRNMYQDLHRYH